MPSAEPSHIGEITHFQLAMSYVNSPVWPSVWLDYFERRPQQEGRNERGVTLIDIAVGLIVVLQRSVIRCGDARYAHVDRTTSSLLQIAELLLKPESKEDLIRDEIAQSWRAAAICAELRWSFSRR
jgi:hypothetical protein